MEIKHLHSSTWSQSKVLYLVGTEHWPVSRPRLLWASANGGQVGREVGQAPRRIQLSGSIYYE